MLKMFENFMGLSDGSNGGLLKRESLPKILPDPGTK
jgi:hypothetical protein